LLTNTSRSFTPILDLSLPSGSGDTSAWPEAFSYTNPGTDHVLLDQYVNNSLYLLVDVNSLSHPRSFFVNEKGLTGVEASLSYGFEAPSFDTAVAVSHLKTPAVE